MNRPRNEQKKPIIMALGAGAAAAIAAMMVPVGIIESMTGATGLSELIPATGAPLGAKARAIIAFFAGAVTLMLAMGYLMRRNSETQPAYKSDYDSPGEDDIEASGSSLLSKLQTRMSGFKTSNITVPSMPWAKKHDDDILDLADLPQLRGHDAHPDAPSRRPISALTDLADASLTRQPAPMPSPAQPSTAMPSPVMPSPVMPSVNEPVAQQDEVQEFAVPHYEVPQYDAPVQANEAAVPTYTQAEPEHISAVISPAATEIPAPMAHSDAAKQPIADLLSQLAASIAARTQQLAAIESLAAEVAAAKAALPAAQTLAAASLVQPSVQPAIAEAFAQVAQPAVIQPAATEPAPASIPPRPPLEAVPSSPRSHDDDDMDAALNAALETLQRMNAQGR